MFNTESAWVAQVHAGEFDERLPFIGPGAIPEEARTPAVWRALFSRRGAKSPTGLTLREVPEAMRTTAICTAAIEFTATRNIELVGPIIEDIPDGAWDEPLASAAVQNGPYESLGRVPANFRTTEICTQAVMADGRALQFVPDEYLTDKICHLALASDINALKFFPQGLLSEQANSADWVRDAVSSDHLAASVLAAHGLFTPNLAKAAVSADGRAIKFIPPNLIDDETVELALASMPKLPDDFPAASRFLGLRLAIDSPADIQLSGRMCEVAVKRQWQNIALVPPRLMTARLVRSACKQCMDAINLIPAWAAQLAPDILQYWVAADSERRHMITDPKMRDALGEIA